MTDLFDMRLRGSRRDRAARTGPELFLFDRAFEDVLDRIDIVGRKFERVLLIGSPDPHWSVALQRVADCVDVMDPGPLFAQAAGGAVGVEDRLEGDGGRSDLIVAIGTLDTVNDLPLAFMLLSNALMPGGFFIGAMSGGDTLPRLRSAMRAADAVAEAAAPHVHPRIAASALAPLLEQAGLDRPVVDIDRVEVRYPTFERLICDLRAMGATNILTDRPRTAILRTGLAAARRDFGADRQGGRTVETFEILHFAAWKPGVVTRDLSPARH